MHRDKLATESTTHNGGESNHVTVSSKCTSLCDQDFKSRSCGKIVLVNVMYSGNGRTSTEHVYAILDDQSNLSLIAPELCDRLRVSGEVAEYTLSSCSGDSVMAGRRVSGITVSSLDGSAQFRLPTLVECDSIPQNVSEIPTPDVVKKYPHLRELTSSIPPLEPGCGIHLLIGRDMPAAHHILDQILGTQAAPFAQQLPLGWVVIGEVCLGKAHQPESVHTYFTHVYKDGRNSIFSPCESNFVVKDPDFSDSLFKKTRDDNKIGISVEDREFLKLMDHSFTKDESGLWTAPLPFKTQKPVLPDNRDQAFKRALLLKKSLDKNPLKCEHMVQFMDKIFRNNAAERAPDTEKGEEKWYLPLFGVYHPKKIDQIRGVFDSSAMYNGHCLNDVLLSGPNLTNSLLGVLLRFRRDKYAISADIEQMFYRFLVDDEHRNYLRFFWFENNDPERPLVVYRMRVHVFGNRPSPAVATYGLRKTVENADSDVQQFVSKDFYVDDALTSKPTREETINLLERTRRVLKDHGQIRLHKITSNDTEIMGQFPKEDLGTTLKDLDMGDVLPMQRSLGLTWDLNLDVFSFVAPSLDRAFTRRGLLSAVNSVFDPVGYVAPLTISGRILLRETCVDGCAWDESLPSTFRDDWNAWKNNLEELHGYQVPRRYISESVSVMNNIQVHIYSDASESAIAAAAYFVVKNCENFEVGFIMGKAKLAPKCANSIPRLELCAAVLAVEVGDFISAQLDIAPSAFRFFTDSMVVLGYISNRTRRFYTYVSNRVAQIHTFSEPSQWQYVKTDRNPADAATRLSSKDMKAAIEKWHAGPTDISESYQQMCSPCGYPLQHPMEDADVRPEVTTMTTRVTTMPHIIDTAERFSTWKSLVSAFSTLIHVARTYSGNNQTKCAGWHLCKETKSPDLKKDAELLLLSQLQKKTFCQRGKGSPRQ